MKTFLFAILAIIRIFIVLLAFSLQYIADITFIFILLDVLLIFFGIFPIFLPDKYMSLKIFQVKTYDNITNSILMGLSVIILYIHWDIVDVMLNGLWY